MLDVGCYVFMAAKISAVFDYNIRNMTLSKKKSRGHMKLIIPVSS